MEPRFYLALLFLLAFGVFNSFSVEKQTDPVSSDAKKSTEDPLIQPDITHEKPSTTTDAQSIKREEEAIKLDGLNVAQIREMREKSEKFAFQAEVDRMMKLIINSLYKNKEIFLRELISNGSDALDKIRMLSLTDQSALDATDELSIRIFADKESNSLHITDTGVGMTKEDLLNNLGTIAKSGTADFVSKLAKDQAQSQSADLIGQFGVGFYSAFLVADRVTVISKHSQDEQYIWESDANSFSVAKDPRGNTLKRGTKIILHLKPETREYLEADSLRDLVKKYSQFINFPIFLWSSSSKMVEEKEEIPAADQSSKKADEDATVEEEKEPPTSTKKVEKTVWDWQLVNENKPIWTRKPADVKEEEYQAFYKAFTNAYDNPLAKIHFTAEGEVTFKSILFIPEKAPHDIFRTMERSHQNIKLFVRRVFITDSFHDMLPNYLNFVRGVVDSDDLPLNVSRETLQQSKLLKVIKRKLVRKVIEMIKKLDEKSFDTFWKEFSTNIKLGVVDDNSNRNRLAGLLRFWSSAVQEKQTSLEDYVKRMKTAQKTIFYVAGEDRQSLQRSPLVERVLKKGYEVLFMVDPIDEYTVNALPDFEGKKFQNLAKEGLEIDADPTRAKERKEAQAKQLKPLMDYLKDEALKDSVEKVEISDRLAESPCALVATQWGHSGNMERIMRAQAYKRSEDPQTATLSHEKRILEINPRHPLIKELNSRVQDGQRRGEETTRNMAQVLFETAALRSGYQLRDVPGFAARVEHMMRLGLNVGLDEAAEVEEEEEEQEPSSSGSAGDPKDSTTATTTTANPPQVKTDEEMEDEKSTGGAPNKEDDQAKDEL